jgi:murein DD-endopeptidase MepM/ murein hydrolase activator NlpD
MPTPLVCDDRSTATEQKSQTFHPPASLFSGLFTSLLVVGFLATHAGPAKARDYSDRSPSLPAGHQSAVAPQNMAASDSDPASTDAAASVEIAVRRGDSLSKILRAQAIPDDNRQAVLAAISDIFDPASLQIGMLLRFTFAPSTQDAAGSVPLLPGSRRIQTVELLSDGVTAFTVHVDAESPLPDQVAAQLKTPAAPSTSSPASSSTAPQAATPGSSIWIAANKQQAGGEQADDADQFVVRRAAGIVGKDFRNTLQAVHLPAPLIDEILVGFKAMPSQQHAAAAHDMVPQNAAFDVIYEGVLRGGKFAAPQLRYAMINDGHKTRRIYRYQTDDATTALMQADGHGVALIDLGRPLQINARITSPFGWRIHPVFGDRRFHEGVDFGAPTGTPVIATSDGLIEDIGWRGNYGDYIRLRHDGHLATAYAHLSGFARGLKRGSTVKRGDVIAYVGRTGVATGPHLYYEVLVDGKQIDPMKTPPAVAVNLKGAQLAEFQKFVETTPEE